MFSVITICAVPATHSHRFLIYSICGSVKLIWLAHLHVSNLDIARISYFQVIPKLHCFHINFNLNRRAQFYWHTLDCSTKHTILFYCIEMDSYQIARLLLIKLQQIFFIYRNRLNRKRENCKRRLTRFEFLRPMQ